MSESTPPEKEVKKVGPQKGVESAYIIDYANDKNLTIHAEEDSLIEFFNITEEQFDEITDKKKSPAGCLIDKTRNIDIFGPDGANANNVYVQILGNPNTRCKIW